jgi:hypothetical protein
MDFEGVPKTVTRLRVLLTNQSGNRVFACPTYRFSMPDSGAASITVTMPPEVSYFRRITFEATMVNWGASQRAETSGAVSNPATSSRAAAVCDVFNRGIQRFVSASRASARGRSGSLGK